MAITRTAGGALVNKLGKPPHWGVATQELVASLPRVLGPIENNPEDFRERLEVLLSVGTPNHEKAVYGFKRHTPGTDERFRFSPDTGVFKMHGGGVLQIARDGDTVVITSFGRESHVQHSGKATGSWSVPLTGQAVIDSGLMTAVGRISKRVR